MKKNLFVIFFLLGFTQLKAQKVQSIEFHLYTDSLKKGFFNYINVDGRTSEGNWLPLSEKELRFSLLTDSSNAKKLYFEGNDLFIDSSYSADSVKIRAALRANAAIWREVTIYIRKNGFEPLKTEEEILQEMRRESGKNRRNNRF